MEGGGDITINDIESTLVYENKTIGETLAKSATIAVGIYDEPFLGLGGYGGTDTLTSIGTNSPTVDITLPYNQGVAHITYNSVSVVDNNSGSFNVVFDEQVGIDDDQTIFNKTVNNSSSIVQLL